MSTLIKPIVKAVVKYGLKWVMSNAAEKIAASEKPEKAALIVSSVKDLGVLVTDGANAVADGKFDDAEQTAFDAKVDTVVEDCFSF